MPDQDDPCDDWSDRKIPDTNNPTKETNDDNC
jgi:hypothetical protein